MCIKSNDDVRKEIKRNCFKNICMYSVFKECTNSNCKYIHPTTKQMWKKLKKHGGINDNYMESLKIPFCMHHIIGKCAKNNKCEKQHLTAGELVTWLYINGCLRFHI
jgi:hypothetical protein